jgi:hypothetical protein
VLSSPDELRAHARAWDDLWQASASRLPSLRAEPLAVWIESFATGQAVRLIVVEDADFSGLLTDTLGKKRGDGTG